ncbi:MAG: hypothetical protein KF865_06445 [Bdellovibrionaceae bacterium]|nr:hypothetical protein [Pseudobdellovibrionaceae bacterium]
MYWVLLVPFVVFLFALEVIRDDNPNLRDLFRRIVFSVLLLLTFDWTLQTIAVVGDAVTEKISGLQKLSEVLQNLGPNYSGKDSWFNVRETILYVFSVAAYLIAYLGFFVATALTHFVWTILYVAAPLMILMYVSRHTERVTMSLYKGLVQVVIWKILWSILGVLLLKLAMQPEVTGLEDYIMSIVVNLCIGFSMLFIPIATRSLVSDGMSSVASSLAAVPTIAAGGAVKMAAAKYGGKIAGAAAFAAKPATNPIAGRMEMMKDRLKPRFEKAKQAYGAIGLPQEILKKRAMKEKRNE